MSAAPPPTKLYRPSAWNLARSDGHGRWRIVVGTCLDWLAEAWGILDTIRATITRHRTERAGYRRALRITNNPWADLALDTWADQTAPPPGSSPLVTDHDSITTALDLLQRELGGYVTVT